MNEGSSHAQRGAGEPSFIVSGNPGRDGGGTYTGGNLQRDPTIQDYEDIFGPAARDIKLDPERNRRRQRWHLPDALKGQNPWLADRIDGLITDTKTSPFTSVILPYKHIDNVDGKIKWNVWSFDEGMASRVPYESAARVLTQTKRSFAGYTIRHGLAIVMEANFMMSDAGRSNFKNQLEQVVGSIQYTNDLDVHVALIEAPSYQKHVDERYWTNSKTNLQRLREYVDLFGFMQKNPNALDIAIEEAKEILHSWGSKDPNFMVCNSKLTMQLTMTPERTQYFTQGEDGIRRLQEGPQINKYRGINIIPSRKFSTETGTKPRDLLTRRVRVGEYYRIPPHRENHKKTFQLYDESRDSWFTLTYDDLVKRSGYYDSYKGSDEMYEHIKNAKRDKLPPAASGDYLDLFNTAYRDFFDNKDAKKFLNDNVKDMELGSRSARTKYIINFMIQRKHFSSNVELRDTMLTKINNDTTRALHTMMTAFFNIPVVNDLVINDDENISDMKAYIAFLVSWMNPEHHQAPIEEEYVDKHKGSFQAVFAYVYGNLLPDEERSLEFILVRPNIEHNMHAVILGRGGMDELGATLWGQTQLECYSDSMHGIWGMSYKYNARAMVWNEKNLIRLWDISYASYSGGKDCSILDWSHVEEFEQKTNELAGPYDGPSLLVMGFDVGMKWTNWGENWPSPVTFQQTQHELAADPSHEIRMGVSEVYHVISPSDHTYRNALGDFAKYTQAMNCVMQTHLSSKPSGEASHEGITGANSGLLFQGSLRVLNEEGRMISEIHGSGHHGPDYVGVASKRNGKGMTTNRPPTMGVFAAT
eukprot:2402635-Rhodomonas_salina.4